MTQPAFMLVAVVVRWGGAMAATCSKAGCRGALARAPPADLRRLLAERGIGQCLQRLVERCELAGQLEEVLVVVGPAVQLRELVADPVEPLEEDVEAAVRDVLAIHRCHLRDASSARERTTRAPSPRAPATSSNVPTAATCLAAPTCASA